MDRAASSLNRADREARFEEVFDAHSADVLAYLLRRVDQPADAADCVAEVFLVVWRRLDEISRTTDVRPWLFGVARHVLTNDRRRSERARSLAERLRQDLVAHPPVAGPEPGAGAKPVGATLRSLSDADRELLMLVGWDGLAPGAAAVSLGMTAGTVRVRLHRARRRLRVALERVEGAVEPSPRMVPHDDQTSMELT